MLKWSKNIFSIRFPIKPPWMILLDNDFPSTSLFLNNIDHHPIKYDDVTFDKSFLFFKKEFTIYPYIKVIQLVNYTQLLFDF